MMMNFRDRYLEALAIRDKSQLEAARTLAHNIRQFEIELYWKRATYFWAFQLIAFTALGLLLKDGEIKSLGRLTVPAALGVITALAGVLTARGSKFWQQNWEAHVDMLENEMGMRLTQVVVCPNFLPQYSVSRINQFLLFLLMLGWWALLIVGAIPQAAEFLRSFPPLFRGIGVLIAVVLACVLMLRLNKTNFTGRMYRSGEPSWTEYASKRKPMVPSIIWRDPRGETVAREPEVPPDPTT